MATADNKDEEVFSWMADEAGARRRRGQKIVCVMDGQPSLRAVRKMYLPGKNVVEILDLLHATPRLWEAAYLFHREGSEEAASFVRDRLLRMLRGEAGYQPVEKVVFGKLCVPLALPVP